MTWPALVPTEPPTWWAVSGPRSTVGHLVRGPIGGVSRARCGKRANPETGWVNPPQVGRACLKCVAGRTP